MPEFPPLDGFGNRIMVIGLSNSGKSSLAEAMGHKTGIPVVHIDQLRHLPNTNWLERDDAEFKAMHDAAMSTDAWIADGGYSSLMAPRLARVTGIIVLDERLAIRIKRYVWRSLFQRRRAGGLEGQQDSVRWKMVRWLWISRNGGAKYRHLAQTHGVPHLIVNGTRELNALYSAWGLRRG